MKDVIKKAAIRAGRTFAQVFLGVYLTGVSNVDSLVGLGDVDVLNSAVTAAIVATLTLLQNMLEGAGDVSYDRG